MILPQWAVLECLNTKATGRIRISLRLISVAYSICAGNGKCFHLDQKSRSDQAVAQYIDMPPFTCNVAPVT
jgi:hypothetical protein